METWIIILLFLITTISIIGIFEITLNSMITRNNYLIGGTFGLSNVKISKKSVKSLNLSILHSSLKNENKQYNEYKVGTRYLYRIKKLKDELDLSNRDFLILEIRDSKYLNLITTDAKQVYLIFEKDGIINKNDIKTFHTKNNISTLYFTTLYSFDSDIESLIFKLVY